MVTRQCHLVHSKTRSQECKWTSGDGHPLDEHRLRLRSFEVGVAILQACRYTFLFFFTAPS